MRFEGQFIPFGTITLWAGNTTNIPGGWGLCDGTNSTPDLRNNFIVGAGDTYAPYAAGGNPDHSHTGEPTHTHTIDAGTGIAAGSDKVSYTGAPQKAGVTGNTNTLPPYYALCYIMKI